VLTGTVDTTERLFVEENLELVTMSNTVEDIHSQQVVINSQKSFFKDGSNFELGGGNFVVTGLDGNTQLGKFILTLTDGRQDTGGDLTKVMIFELLVTRGETTQQGTTGDLEIRTESVKTTVNQEVFLFSTEGSVNKFGAVLCKTNRKTLVSLTADFFFLALFFFHILKTYQHP
jgi:hypothetical protein